MADNNQPLKLIVISGPDDAEVELKVLHQMFEEGLEYFHLRKPKFSTAEMKRYLNKVDKRYLHRIIIHSHHELAVTYKLRGVHFTQKHRKGKYWKSWFMLRYIRFRNSKAEITVGYHTIGALKRHNPGYNYVFLSPVFDSISKMGYRSTFNEDSLKEALGKTEHTVIAMGGIDEDKIARARVYGFHGVALLGSIWKATDPITKFRRIKALCERSGNM